MSLTNTIVVWTVRALGEDLGVTGRTITRYIENGTLPATKGARGYEIEPADAEEFRALYRKIGRPRTKANKLAELTDMVEERFAQYDAAMARLEAQHAVHEQAWAEIQAEMARLGMGQPSAIEREDRRRAADVTAAGR